MIHHQNKRIVKMMNMLFFVLYLATTTTVYSVDNLQRMSKDDLELERQLSFINTEAGYIVDCVDIYKQPAFDHPLLQNHKLQMKPSFEEKNSQTSMKISSTKSIYGLEKVSCPKGTVPIRRVTKDDLIRGKYLFNDRTLTQNGFRTGTAHVFLRPSGGPYYGVNGTTSVWHPSVVMGQESAGHLYVQNGNGDGTNKIIVGWHVFPQLYHNDNATHLYTYWKSGNANGCYNILCSGFVQTAQEYFVGSRIPRTSVYRGAMTEMPISLVQDPASKNWWLSVAFKSIGYFPAHLFSNLKEAGEVGWGGLTVTPSGTNSPPMGTGDFVNGDFSEVCYFRHVAYQSVSRKFIGPATSLASTFNDCPKCYNVVYYGDKGGQFGYSLQFGGGELPCNCDK
ncbi:uncharacterized protein LOC123920587 [Trifolium pratense]|uniref:uncharacterized protein LOC123920587 n=1 Tax=Trifolium pratense TaxID=57577 RepID=UPI001E6964F6|nr:uncharacterized protein LOC123920587 [Trifolium pratense]